jgi:hypothetical protein
MRRINTKVTAIITLICFFISGCTVITTTISSKQSNVSLMVVDRTYSSLPIQDEFAITTFGNYEYLAEKEGYEPLYGVLPLNTRIGHMVLDILFFAPLMLFNLREVFPYYEINIDKKLIRYSYDKTEWWESSVSPGESEQARKYFKEAGKKEVQYHPEKDKSTSNVDHSKNLISEKSALPAMEADQSYKKIKGIELYNGNVIEGQIIKMNTDVIIIRTKDGKVSSYSFINDVAGFIKE